jgi:hypothetical protein
MALGYLGCQKLMRHWHELFADRIYDIQYENLISQPAEEIAKLLQYCGLEWNDACVEFHKTDRAVETPSSFQVKQPIYNSSVGSWKNYFKHLEPLVQALAGNTTEAGKERLITINGRSHKVSDLSTEALAEL